MCIPGVYFLSHEDLFIFAPLRIDPVLPSTAVGVRGKACTARLVSDELVEWMRQSVERALTNHQVSDDAIHAAIQQFYRVRDCLESDGDSEPLIASQIAAWLETEEGRLFGWGPRGTKYQPPTATIALESTEAERQDVQTA